MILDTELQAITVSLLEKFHERRLVNLRKTTIGTLLRKNPYLYRAIGLTSASDYIQIALDALISSSDETIFGNEFFEPLAKWAATAAYRDRADVTVQVGGGSGFDISIESSTEYHAIAVKSGTKIFNAQSGRQQDTEFAALEARIRKEKKVLHKIIGYGYGRKSQRGNNHAIVKLAGQNFWAEITTEDNFYQRISMALGDAPSRLSIDFHQHYDEARNRLEAEFHASYTGPDGVVDWSRVIAFSSARVAPRAKNATRKKSRDSHD